MLKGFALLQNFVSPVRRDDRGITSVEYGLLLFIVAAGLITALGIFTPVSPPLRQLQALTGWSKQRTPIGGHVPAMRAMLLALVIPGLAAACGSRAIVRPRAEVRRKGSGQ